ncbi:MAG: hypothetical protein U9N85_13450 [Bacteroidota bacterium]|nr:hypothetical protein [Bacteroidota bacterium]
MTEKKYLVPLLLIGLGVAFIFVSIMVTLTRGNSALWIAKKIKLGAMLLSFTAFASCTGGGETMCYAAEATDNISIAGAKGTKITIHPDSNHVLTGDIYNWRTNKISYALFKDSTKLMAEDIQVSDKSLDSIYEEFEITLDKTLDTGTYSVRFFPTEALSQDSSIHLREFMLTIQK